MRTSSTLNRCLPHIDTSKTTTRFCVDPPCSAVGESCVPSATRPFELPEGAWQLTAHSQNAKCGREMDLEQTAITRQPNSGPWFDSLLQLASQLEAAYNAALSNQLGIAIYGVALPLGLCFVWMLFLFLCSGAAVALVLLLIGLLLLSATLLFLYKGGLGGNYVGALVNISLDQIHKVELSLETSSPEAYELIESTLANPLVANALTIEADMVTAYKWLALVMGILFIIHLLVVCLASRQIERTTRLVVIATQVVKSAPGMVIFPLFISAIQVCLMGLAAVSLAYLLSDHKTQTYSEHKSTLTLAQLTPGFTFDAPNLDASAALDATEAIDKSLSALTHALGEAASKVDFNALANWSNSVDLTPLTDGLASAGGAVKDFTVSKLDDLGYALPAVNLPDLPHLPHVDLPDVDLPDLSGVHLSGPPNVTSMLSSLSDVEISLTARQWQYVQVGYLGLIFTLALTRPPSPISPISPISSTSLISPISPISPSSSPSLLPITYHPQHLPSTLTLTAYPVLLTYPVSPIIIIAIHLQLIRVHHSHSHPRPHP